MRASIIVASHNRVLFTRVCVQALIATIARSDDVEVIVVDNGSSDATPAFLSSLSSPFRVIRNQTNLGFAHACNQGADTAQGEHLIFLNNDTVPLPGWLDTLLEQLHEPDVGVVGSKLLFPNDTIQHAGIVINEDLIPAHIYYAFPASYPTANLARDYQAVTGACLAIRREFFFQLGSFDEGYRNSFEDVDLCLRVGIAGQRVVYVPTSVLYHFESMTEGRHKHDHLNLVRYLDRWRHVVKPDELQFYRQEGFTAVPKIQVRTMEHALAQERLERRRADALANMVSSLLSLPDVETAPHVARPGVFPRLEFVTSVPSKLTIGDELQVDAHLQLGPQERLGTPMVRYAWRRPGVDVDLWCGEANMSRRSNGTTIDVSAHLPVPSIAGTYTLEWLLDDGTRCTELAVQSIMVAPRFAVEFRAQLPDVIRSGELFLVLVTLKNCGLAPLLPHAAFRLSYHWFDETGHTPVIWEGQRSPISQRLDTGEEGVMEAMILAPPSEGTHQFVWDVVIEGVHWLSSFGIECPRIPVHVHANVASGDAGESESRSMMDMRFTAELARKERRAASFEAALRVSQDAAVMSQRAIVVLEEQVRERDRQIANLNELVNAYQGGRAMRLLTALSKLRQGLER